MLYLVMIAISVFWLAGMTGAYVWILNMAKPEQRHKVFLLTMAFRLLLSAIMFAISVYTLHPDIEKIKVYTVIFVATYFLFLIFDTGYFYYTSNKKK